MARYDTVTDSATETLLNRLHCQSIMARYDAVTGSATETFLNGRIVPDCQSSKARYKASVPDEPLWYIEDSDILLA